MSIWASRWTLWKDTPLGAPYEVDWPGQTEQAPNAMVDLATAVGGTGWVRLAIVDPEDGEAEVMLSPEQVQGLRDALSALLENREPQKDK